MYFERRMDDTMLAMISLRKLNYSDQPGGCSQRALLIDAYCKAPWLLDHGVDVSGPDARLRVPLYMAAYRGHLEIIQLLVCLRDSRLGSMLGANQVQIWYYSSPPPKH